MKKLLIIIIAVIFSFVIFERIPIKRSISIEDANENLSNESMFVCEYVATTGPSWKVYKKEETKARLVCLEGKAPFNYLNMQTFFFFSANKFLIQGEVIGKQLVDSEGDIKNYYGDNMKECLETMDSMDSKGEKYECYDIIDVTEWDIIAPIDRGDSFRLLAPKNYLSLLDFIG